MKCRVGEIDTMILKFLHGVKKHPTTCLSYNDCAHHRPSVIALSPFSPSDRFVIIQYLLRTRCAQFFSAVLHHTSTPYIPLALDKPDVRSRSFHFERDVSALRTLPTTSYVPTSRLSVPVKRMKSTKTSMRVGMGRVLCHSNLGRQGPPRGVKVLQGACTVQGARN